jgi:general stress protein YciG
MSNENRGLASADEETKERVAKKGGEAPHEKRGLQAADEETKERVAREGGKASHKND